ncbi:MAG: methyltransferase domain-containing protein [Candidatus Nealsonbacteria bacterium]|nr:methyltransferase domain-containing protein [Candidatus Nealsonbacteria bacterium]
MKITIEKIKRKSIEMPRNFFLFKVGPILRFLKKRPLPENSDRKILIHIGCGDFNDSRYINVDTRSGWHIHHKDSVENINKIFPENYADLIYACMVLEHVSYLKLSEVFKNLYKSLKTGGVLRVSVPNFDVILEMYKETKSIEGITPPLMGGQGYADNFHYSVFNEKFLRELFVKNGFKDVKSWIPGAALYHNFNDWSGRRFPLGGKEWEISLNIEAVK